MEIVARNNGVISTYEFSDIGTESDMLNTYINYDLSSKILGLPQSFDTLVIKNKLVFINQNDQFGGLEDSLQVFKNISSNTYRKYNIFGHNDTSQQYLDTPVYMLIDDDDNMNGMTFATKKDNTTFFTVTVKPSSTTDPAITRSTMTLEQFNHHQWVLACSRFEDGQGYHNVRTPIWIGNPSSTNLVTILIVETTSAGYLSVGIQCKQADLTTLHTTDEHYGYIDSLNNKYPLILLSNFVPDDIDKRVEDLEEWVKRLYSENSSYFIAR